MKVSFKDIFTGIAIGDAYGAGLEFQDRNWIRQHIDFSVFVNKRTDINVPEKEVFTIDYHEWDYTDDTEMSIAVAKAIMSEKPFTDDLLVEYFTSEYQDDFRKKGYYRNGHGSMRWVYNGEKKIEDVREFQRQKKYPGNAPPMRAVPIGFLPANLIDQYATVNATCTHPNPKAIDASILVARAAEALLVKQLDEKDLITYCAGFISDEETKSLLMHAGQLTDPGHLLEKDYEILCGPQPLPRKSFAGGLNGLPSNAMYTAVCALYILKHSRSAFDALKHSVSMGGDVDSLAAICTGIAAGKYGIGSIPAYMQENVEGRDYLATIAHNFEKHITELKNK